jgi:hypothetical protein
MSCRRLALCVLTSTVTIGSLSLKSVVADVFAQGAEKSTTTTKAAPPRGSLRTTWGAPNIEGIWSFTTNTPLERPAEFGDREFLTPEEIAARNKEAESERPDVPGDPGTYNAFWFDRGKSVGRTSLITSPRNGRIPPFTSEARTRQAAARAIDGYDSWENRGLSERCLTRPTLGPPIIPGNYNNFLRLVQTPTHVVILVEQPTVARVVPLDGRPHLDKQIREWLGDGRGHWEGNTLVVETTNFTDKTNFRGSGGGMRLIERFTRVDAASLTYEFTVDDPASFTSPWTAAIPMTRTEEQIYEYACHEGNHTVVNVLSGARAEEKTAAAAKAGPR